MRIIWEYVKPDRLPERRISFRSDTRIRNQFTIVHDIGLDVLFVKGVFQAEIPVFLGRLCTFASGQEHGERKYRDQRNDNPV